jgi:hemerythrin-like metal-binding protein
MVKYTVVHFSSEERILKANAYPDFVAHKKIHEEFTAKIMAMQKDCTSAR